jgi:hypothetical protein
MSRTVHGRLDVLERILFPASFPASAGGYEIPNFGTVG